MEIFDPVRGAFEEAGTLALERAGLTATPYPSSRGDRVLFAGGRGPAGAQDSADLYAPGLRAVSDTRALLSPRAGHTAVALSGAILLLGGHPTNQSGEVFRFDTESLAPTVGRMGSPRLLAAAVVTDAGRVLVGGSGATIELYDPATGQFTHLVELSRPRERLALAPLPGDAALVASGGEAGTPLAEAELVRGSSLSSTERPMEAARYGHTLTALSGGAVLVVGGAAAPGEVFEPN